MAVCASLFNSYMNASNLSMNLLLINVGILVVAFAYGAVMSKKAHMTISYEVVE